MNHKAKELITLIAVSCMVNASLAAVGTPFYLQVIAAFALGCVWPKIYPAPKNVE